MKFPSLTPSHVIKVKPDYALQPGDTSNTIGIEISEDDQWLIGLHSSIENEDFQFDVLYLSKIALNLRINNEKDGQYTSNGRGSEYVLLSDFHGDWQQSHQLMRRVHPEDVIYVTWKHVGADDLVLPSLTLQLLRGSDFPGLDLSDLMTMLGPLWHEKSA